MNLSLTADREPIVFQRARLRSAARLLSIALAVALSLGCASTRGAGASGVEQIGGRESTLSDCERHGRLCAGLTVAVLDLEVAAGRACFPDGITLEQVEDVIAEALKVDTSDEAAQVAAGAIRASYPCASAPSPFLTTTATDLPPLVTRPRRMETLWLAS
jgi:hypothetical protein